MEAIYPLQDTFTRYITRHCLVCVEGSTPMESSLTFFFHFINYASRMMCGRSECNAAGRKRESSQPITYCIGEHFPG